LNSAEILTVNFLLLALSEAEEDKVKDGDGREISPIEWDRTTEGNKEEDKTEEKETNASAAGRATWLELEKLRLVVGLRVCALTAPSHPPPTPFPKKITTIK
jgi:hypothetical protein